MTKKTITEILPTTNENDSNHNTTTKTCIVSAYIRVSSNRIRQQDSFENQKRYFEDKLSANSSWSKGKIYSDFGISGTGSKFRVGFNQLLEDCKSGKVNLILTKSISRFGRNTIETIKTIRELRSIGVGVYFEKENINTLDDDCDFVLTILSSLAQEESRSLSKNISWSIRKQFAKGNFTLAYSNFLGYDKGTEKYSLVVNLEEAKIVKFIFKLSLMGYGVSNIAKILLSMGVPSPQGNNTWHYSTIISILTNEKYKGDALLQKTYTSDFLTGKKTKNDGFLPQYYSENNHEAIISRQTFDYILEKRLNRGRLSLLLSGKIKCKSCSGYFKRKRVHSTSYNNLVWFCPCRKVNNSIQNKIYQDYLVYKLHVIAMKKAIAMGVNAFLFENLENKLKVTRDSVWEMHSYLDELMIIIEEIIIEEQKIQIRWIDGSVSKSVLERYTPILGIRK